MPLLFTGYAAPSKPPRTMFRKRSPPIEPSRAEAPITATLRGSKNGRSEAVTATWSRSATLVRRPSVAPIGKRRLDLAALDLALDLEADVREDDEHVAVLGEHVGDEARDPELAGAERELLEQARADAAALLLVGHGERDLGRGRVAQARVARERDDALGLAVAGERADEGAALDQSGVEVRLDEAVVDRLQAVEAQVEAAVGEAREEVDEARPRRRRAERAGAACRRP